jgi:RNA polymerase sigma factor (sigma-70 family)
VPLEGLAVLSPTPDAERLDIRAALEDLAASDVQQAHVVTLRYFEGCSVEEAAGRLGISPATVKREWHRARAWLHRRLRRPA